ncbi:MAG: PilZ domain-containing protein [Deltaproteobacteria bacterium]|nr:PilZ domain-containing protein [Deltaproteobacteria bacterium]
MLKKRAHLRYECELPVQITSDRDKVSVTAINISLGGMSVEPAEKLTFGSTVTVRFNLPSSNSATEVDATVRWIKDNRAGLQFGSLRAKDVRGINKLFKKV